MSVEKAFVFNEMLEFYLLDKIIEIYGVGVGGRGGASYFCFVSFFGWLFI